MYGMELLRDAAPAWRLPERDEWPRKNSTGGWPLRGGAGVEPATIETKVA
jgi:hypothetical protein